MGEGDRWRGNPSYRRGDLHALVCEVRNKMIGSKVIVRCIALMMLVSSVHADYSEVTEDEAEPKTNSPGDISEVVITGTHIPGEAPVGASIKTYSREQVR